MISHLASQKTPLMISSDGVSREVTVEGIQKDLAHFQRMDPTSDQKSYMYKRLTEQLDFLESEGLWPDDTRELRKLVEKSYKK